MRLFTLGLALVIFVVDVATKWWISNGGIPFPYTVIEGLFSIRYVQNEGIAFGLFHDVNSDLKIVVLSAMAIVAILVVLHYVWHAPASEHRLLVSLGLLLGGILGNFVDRLWHHYVIDFLEFHWYDSFAWPTFNVADAAITTGVLLIVYESFFGQSERSNETSGKALADE